MKRIILGFLAASALAPGLAAQESPCELDQTVCQNYVNCNNGNSLPCTSFTDEGCPPTKCSGESDVDDSGQSVFELAASNVNCSSIRYKKWKCVQGLPSLSDNKTLTCASNCPPDDTDPYCEECECEPPACSPILISVRGNRLELTDWSGGVEFDLNADGLAKQLAWTQGGADDAFLVLDRNGNGVIDNGRELFGNFTPQPPSEMPNGFIALATFDRACQEGNGDGWISSDDAAFADLGLWIDRNHDGISQAGEIRPLSSSRIAGISLDYRETRRKDRHGNTFRFMSRVKMSPESRPPVRFAVDVFLVAPP